MHAAIRDVPRLDTVSRIPLLADSARTATVRHHHLPPVQHTAFTTPGAATLGGGCHPAAGSRLQGQRLGIPGFLPSWYLRLRVVTPHRARWDILRLRL